MKNKDAKINKQIKKERKESIKKKRWKHFHWTCIICHKIVNILASERNIELYTKEREKKFVCLNCK